MVLEISATPYIFTFKLWDWGRLGMDGLPRPIHLDHGMKNIQWNRDTKWVYDNIVGQQKILEKQKPVKWSAPDCTAASLSTQSAIHFPGRTPSRWMTRFM